MINQEFHEITPALEELAAKAQAADVIDSSLYVEHDVKRGLRDLNGVGVLAGLTHVSEVRATKVENGVKVPDYGNLSTAGTISKTSSEASPRAAASASKKWLTCFCSAPCRRKQN